MKNSASTISIEENSQVTLHFKLQLEAGNIVDQTDPEQPVTLNIGDGTLKTCFEETLIGLTIGDKQQVTIDPRMSFGFRDETLIQAVEPSLFKDLPNAGDILPFNQDGEEILGTIIEIKDGAIIIDFNHPLAGHTITFSAEIIHVNQPNLH
ncbi:MAG: peptidylprolyl isomerase [Methylococcales bacterium]|jgi:FKBP-type peptidyl-prolyl cis-trans isomerase SlpA|nr:peptidylprolyl isomerase [Methylococcales bacterium]MBT7444058.1 peptidylprolyl isomerase [Methylococcales bacterium]